MRANAKRTYLTSYFEEPWRDAFENRADTTTSFLDGAGILLMDDKAGEVDRLMAGFLRAADDHEGAVTHEVVVGVLKQPFEISPTELWACSA